MLWQPQNLLVLLWTKNSFSISHSFSACTKISRTLSLFGFFTCFLIFCLYRTCKMEANVYIAAILQLAGGIIMISMELAPSGNVHSLVSSHEHHHQGSLQLHSLDSSDYDKESIGSNSKSRPPACFLRIDTKQKVRLSSSRLGVSALL